MENDTPRRMPNVPPFVKFVCANVPMVFDDSLSYYEALCALWKYVQGMTDVINNNATLEEEYIEKFNELSGKFDELKTYVETYFDNLDVQEEINNKLDDMAEDGTLQRLLQARDFADNTELYFRTMLVKSKKVDGISNMNGGCVLPDNSIIQFTGVNGEVYHFAQDGAVLNSNTIANIGHCNSCCYNSKTDKVYVTVTGSSTIGYYKIFEIDPLTLTLTDTIDCADKDFPAPQLGICYDEENDCYIFGNWWNGERIKYLWKTDSEFNVIESVTSDIGTVDSTSNVNMFGSYVGISNMGTHQMFLFNKNDLSYYKTVTINELISNTWVITEEQWWGTRADGKIIMGCHAGASANPHRAHETYIYAIFDPQKNYAEFPYGDNYPPRDEFYYVDHTYTGNDRNGSGSAPFNNIYEALNASLRTTGCTGSVTIRFNNASEDLYDPIFTVCKNYRIWFPNQTIDFFSSIAVGSGVTVECNRPIELQLLDSKTNPFGEGAGDIHCYGHLILGGALTTPDNVSPILRGFNDAMFEGGFDTCGLDVQNYYGSIVSYGNYLYAVESVIKNLHFAYNNNYFPNEYKGIKGTITKNDSDKYVIPALSKVIMVIPKITITTTGSVNTVYENPMLWNPNTWVNDVITDLDGTNHTVSINTDGTVGVTGSGATINRVKIISM